MNYKCSRCGYEEEVSTIKPTCPCGGLWNLDHTPPLFDKQGIKQYEWSIFRYIDYLPIKSDVAKSVSLGEGMTGIVQLKDGPLLKMDYCMPTLSYKDRGAAVLVAHCKSMGIPAVIQDSSGNAGNSIAAYCAKAGIRCDIFVPEGTSPAKIAMIESHGATVHVIPGSRDQCAAACREKMQKERLCYASHVYNPFFYEGTKTYIYEVFEQLGRIPKTLFVPVGNGTLFLGVIKGLEELLSSGCIPQMPHIVAVQSERCAPLAEAFRHNAKTPASITPKTTLAEGIAIGEPKRGQAILEKVYAYHMEIITAPEEGILEARNLLAAQGVHCEHTSAAIYAAYLTYNEYDTPLQDCLLPITGAGLKSDH